MTRGAAVQHTNADTHRFPNTCAISYTEDGGQSDTNLSYKCDFDPLMSSHATDATVNLDIS